MRNTLTRLGRKSNLTNQDLLEPAAVLEAFANPKPQRDFQVEFVFPEFTSLCPVTGQPDFATITVRYIPNRLCVEMKSLKLYFYAYRNRGIFYEGVVNTILDDLLALLSPRSMQVIGAFNIRGGTAGKVTAEFTARSAGRRSETGSKDGRARGASRSVGRLR